MELQLMVEDEGDVQQQEHMAIVSGGGSKGKGRSELSESHALRNSLFGQKIHNNQRCSTSDTLKPY
jgi:hypothetical protein